MSLYSIIGRCTDTKRSKGWNSDWGHANKFLRAFSYMYLIVKFMILYSFMFFLLRIVDVRNHSASTEIRDIFSVVSWHVKVVFLAVMFIECRTQIFLHFCHFMFNFKRNMWSRIGSYVSSWHVICTWKCVLNTNSVASNPISLTPCNKAVCGEASPQIKMSFAQVHWNPVQALFIKAAPLQLPAEHV